MRDHSNANRVQCEPNPGVGTKRKEKEKEIPASSINEKKEIPPVAVPNNNNKSISLFMSLAVDKQY